HGHGHAHGPDAVIDRVGARAAVHHVVAVGAAGGQLEEGVIAGAAVERLGLGGVGAAAERVVAAAAGDDLDGVLHVVLLARPRARRRVAVVHARADGDGDARRAQRVAHGVARGLAAAAAVERVLADRGG